MTDVVDRRWGHSLVRAPMAREAVRPRDRSRTDAAAPGDTAPVEPAPAPGEEPTSGWDAASVEAWDAALVGDGRLPARTGPGMRTARARPAGPAPEPAPPIAARRKPAPAPRPATRTPDFEPLAETGAWAVLPQPGAVPTDDDLAARLGRLPVAPPAVAPARPRLDDTPPDIDRHPRPAPPASPAEAADDTSLARLARGIQDCARALTSLADRLDRLERRVDAMAIRPPAPAPVTAAPSRVRLSLPDPSGLDARLRALEGLSADRFQGLDQRLRQLENLPAAVARLQHDTAWLADLATTRRVDEAAATREVAAAELAPMYQELDSVAELVSSHHAAATQSLERVRTLERAVLEMRRHLERSQAEHARLATAGQDTADSRLQRLEARLAAVESAPPRPA